MQSVLGEVRHPYRNAARALVPDSAGFHGRKMAQVGSTWLLIALVCRLPVLIAFPRAVSWLVDLVIVVATYLFTLRLDTDTRLVRALGWLLRVFVLLDVAAMVSDALGVDFSMAVRGVLGALVLPLSGMLFCSERLRSLGVVRLRRQGRKVAAAVVVVLLTCAAATYITAWVGVLLVPVFALTYFVLLAYSYWLLVRTRRALAVVLCEWWLDVAQLPRVVWVNYALLGDGRVELLGPERPTRWFENYAAAVFWLSEHEYLPEDTAVKRGLATTRHQPELSARGWRALLRRRWC